MRISEHIAQAQKEDRVWYSFEYFPAKTPQGLLNLYDRIDRMRELGPSFIDITWGAGGTTSELTSQFVRTAHEQFGLETCMHLTCTNMAESMIAQALKDAQEAGCHNILALRGDPPVGQKDWTATEGGFHHAIDLVKYIRKHYGDYFDIAIAGFPEGHPQSEGRDVEMQHMKEKVDAGADFIFTQMFYDVETFFEWIAAVRAVGITIPVIPGIMPIQNWAHFERVTRWCGTIVPQAWRDALEPLKDDDVAVREVGTQLVAEMCRKILESEWDIKGVHFYTMNLEKGTRMILEELDLVAEIDVVNPLPWRPSLTMKRRTESTRPIFWANRQKSYLARTESWDEFPNGRWGDSRSPAFGEMTGSGINLRAGKDNAVELWGKPTSFADITELFAKFCKGELSSLPWSDTPAAKETLYIADQLARMNKLGFLTVNSQPAVDGALSSDHIHGWGPKNGYVYQKAYLEFFASPEHTEALIAKIENDPWLTYYAVSMHGELRSNNKQEGPNAVTWGVFPGKEIVQPTIVERISFMAWKDEAFQLGVQWADMYPEDSRSHRLIKKIFENFWLVNVVNNDFRNPDRLAIFKPFFQLGSVRSSATSTPLATPSSSMILNGKMEGLAVNGH